MPTASLPAEPTDKGQHYEFIKSAVSEPFKNATVSRGQALAATPLNVEPWYTNVGAGSMEKLAAANLKA